VVRQFNIIPTEAYTKHEFRALLNEPNIDKTVERALANLDTARYHMVVPSEIARIMKMIYACKQRLWELKGAGYSVKLMWIPSHVAILGN
jgi:hypothetical protein